MLEQQLLQGRKVIILAEDLYEDVELLYPLIRLREEGAEVTVAGTGKEQYTGKQGHPINTDTSVDNVKADQFNALVIPGGYAPDKFRTHDAILDLTRQMVEQGKVVAAICHAPWVLVSAGVLRDRRVTCYHSVKDDVINAGGRYENAQVVRDGNLITSRGPADLGVFCREIIAALQD